MILFEINENEKPCKSIIYRVFGSEQSPISGERGIRTPGGVTLNSFQDCRIRPLCHFSLADANIETFFNSVKGKLIIIF
jgi:hypothetical protein